MGNIIDFELPHFICSWSYFISRFVCFVVFVRNLHFHFLFLFVDFIYLDVISLQLSRVHQHSWELFRTLGSP